MLVEKFFVPSNELDSVGLQAIEMPRLGRFVALTGKNGAGKSRILLRLENCIIQRNSALASFSDLEKSIEALKKAINSESSREDDPLQKTRRENLAQMEEKREILYQRVFTSIEGPLDVLRFVPKVLTMTDPRSQNQQVQNSYYELARKPGIEGFENNCFSYIQILQNMEFEATHPRNNHADSEKQTVIREYKRLGDLIGKLLKTKLTRSLKGEAMLFEKPMADAGLSSGQIVLIQLAVALHAQKGTLEKTVFIMDEPENHLHPSALIDFLDTLGKVAKDSQFWIATHSVPLLSHISYLEPMAIWYVEKGRVENSGRNPEQVLLGLLGDDKQISSLHTFTSLPAQFAANRYAVECLTAPKTVGGGKGDPQIAQIGGMLNFESSSPISLLDFGAGKSRLLSGLVEVAREKNKTLSEYVSYFAFDPSPDDKQYSLAAIESVYGSKATRHYLSSEAFFSKNKTGCIDLIVMCNVLHEISPDDWLKIFNQDSFISRALGPSGSLLIVEDQRIPVGEKAHKFGFLVLDTPQLKSLFSVKTKDINAGLFYEDEKRQGRLKAHRISRNLLGRVTDDTIQKAISGVAESAKKEIVRLRETKPDFNSGQLHGFWTQQFANASLWLDSKKSISK